MRPPIAPGDSVPAQPHMARLARFVSVFFAIYTKMPSAAQPAATNRQIAGA